MKAKKFEACGCKIVCPLHKKGIRLYAMCKVFAVLYDSFGDADDEILRFVSYLKKLITTVEKGYLRND